MLFFFFEPDENLRTQALMTHSKILVKFLDERDVLLYIDL